MPHFLEMISFLARSLAHSPLHSVVRPFWMATIEIISNSKMLKCHLRPTRNNNNSVIIIRISCTLHVSNNVRAVRTNTHTRKFICVHFQLMHFYICSTHSYPSTFDIYTFHFYISNDRGSLFIVVNANLCAFFSWDRHFGFQSHSREFRSHCRLFFFLHSRWLPSEIHL